MALLQDMNINFKLTLTVVPQQAMIWYRWEKENLCFHNPSWFQSKASLLPEIKFCYRMGLIYYSVGAKFKEDHGDLHASCQPYCSIKKNSGACTDFTSVVNGGLCVEASG